MKRLLSVTVFTALLTLLRMVAGFVIAKLVAIYTGPTGMAMLGQAQGIVMFLNGVATSPAGACVVRFTAENHELGFKACVPWWRASLQWILLALAIIVPSGCFFSSEISHWLFNSTSYYWVVITACVSLPFSIFNSLTSSVLNGQQLYRRFIFLGIITTLITTFINLALIYFLRIDGAVLAVAINAGIAGLVMIFFSLKEPWFKLVFWWGRTETEHRKKVGSYVLMALTSAVTVPLSLVFIRNILIDNVGWEQTGHWQAVWKISEVYLGVITLALSTYFLPKLSSVKGVTAIRVEINNAIKIILPVVVVLAFGIYLSRDIIITLLFTEEFRSARELFTFQLCGDVIKIIAYLYAYPMLSRGAATWFIFNEIFFSISFVFLSWFFIQDFGVKGVSIAYLFNYVFCFLFVYFNLNRFSK